MNFTSTTWWLAVVLIGAGTYLIRVSFLLLLHGRAVPVWARRLLTYIPSSVLPALVAPALLLGGQGAGLAAFDPLSPRALAGLVAALVAWKTRNMFVTIALGMAALWLFSRI